MMILHPIYAAMVGRMARRKFIALVHRFFMVQLVIFYLLFLTLVGISEIWAGRVFFIWTHVFNLFVPGTEHAANLCNLVFYSDVAGRQVQKDKLSWLIRMQTSS
jgi:hypothetical protein